MSAPAQTPTPGDIARRTAPTPAPRSAPAPAATDVQTPTPAASTQPRAGSLTAPGVLAPYEVFRQMFQQAMRISRMRPNSRLVGLTLLGYANFKTGLLNKYQPDLAELSYATGLTKEQVDVQIRVLTQRQWLTRHVPAEGPRQGQEVLKLQIPAAVLQQLRNRRRLEP
ncbi:hypothetical protein ACIPEL_36170 [Streptomyces griseoviridis]